MFTQVSNVPPRRTNEEAIMPATSFWTTYTQRRIGRRRMLQTTTAAGAIAGAALVVGCGSGKSSSSASPGATAPLAQPTSEVDLAGASQQAVRGGQYNLA